MVEAVAESRRQNWVVSWSILVGALFFAAFLYAVLIGYYGTPNPFKWSAKDAFFYWAFVIALLVPALLNYGANKIGLDVERHLGEVFSLDEYRDTRLLDCFLAHYTNVATVGLFLTATILLLRPHVTEVNGFLFGFILAAICCAIFTIYALFVVRLAKGLLKFSRYTYYIALTCAIPFDLSVIRLVIETIPKPGL